MKSWNGFDGERSGVLWGMSEILGVCLEGVRFEGDFWG